MRIMKTKGRRGRGDFFWTVDGVVRVGGLEQAFELLSDEKPYPPLQRMPVPKKDTGGLNEPHQARERLYPIEIAA